MRTINQHSAVVGGDEGMMVKRAEREGADTRSRRDALGVLDSVAVDQREAVEPPDDDDAALAADDIFAWGTKREHAWNPSRFSGRSGAAAHRHGCT